MFCLNPSFKNHKDPKAFHVSDIRQAPHWGFLVIHNMILKKKKIVTIFNTAYVQRPLPRGEKIPLAPEAKVKWFLCDQAEETSGSVPPWSCQISRRTAYKSFRRLNLCFLNGFPILLSGVEESIHLFQYFMDCV